MESKLKTELEKTVRNWRDVMNKPHSYTEQRETLEICCQELERILKNDEASSWTETLFEFVPLRPR